MSSKLTISLSLNSKVWDTFSGDVIHTFQHDHIVRAVDISPSGSHIFTGGMEKKLRRFDLSRPDSQPDVYSAPGASTAHDGMIKSVIWDEGRRLIISASEDKRIRWWDPRLGGGPNSMVAEVNFPDGLASVERSFGGDWLSVASGKKAIFLDTDTRETIFEHTLANPVSSCLLAPRTRDRSVTGSLADGWVRVSDAMSAEMREENKTLADNSKELRLMAI